MLLMITPECRESRRATTRRSDDCEHSQHYKHVYIYIYIHITTTVISLSLSIYIHIYTYTCIYIYIYTYYNNSYISISIYVYIYIYIYIKYSDGRSFLEPSPLSAPTSLSLLRRRQAARETERQPVTGSIVH